MAGGSFTNRYFYSINLFSIVDHRVHWQERLLRPHRTLRSSRRCSTGRSGSHKGQNR